MSADNNVARSKREIDPAAEQRAFEIPPELASRYEVRIVETTDGEQRVGLFLGGDRQTPAIEITNDRIVARNEDPETVASLVKIARHNGWDRIDVEGSPEFRKAVWSAASREGLTVSGYEPTFAEQEAMGERRRNAAPSEERAPAATPAPASAEQARLDAERDDRPVAASAVGPDRAPEPETQAERDDRQRPRESEALADLFLHGEAGRKAADPRLANALQAQAVMEQHIGEVFDGDASRMASASLESRQMISDVLRRGLDVSVREPAPVRQIEPVQTHPDLER